MWKKYSYVYEIPLFYLGITFLNKVFAPEMPAFMDVVPHPYWLGVLLFSFRYGLIAGLISGIISTLLFLVLVSFSSQQYLLNDFSFYSRPAFFILVSIFIGASVEVYRSKLRHAQKNRDEYEKDKKNYLAEIRTLKEIQQGLEKKIVTQTSSLVTLYEGARKLETYEKDDLYNSILEFVSKCLGVEESSIYCLENHQWHMTYTYQWSDYREKKISFSFGEGMVGLAGSRNKIYSIRDFIGQEESGLNLNTLGDCLVAGPLKEGEKGEVVAVLAIQNMPFAKFNSSTLSLLNFLLLWGSRAIERASFINELQNKTILDFKYRVHSYSYFVSRLEDEFLRSKTYMLPLSVGLVDVQGLDDFSSKEQEKILMVLGQVLRNQVRKVDIVSLYEAQGAQFAILFITASEKQANEIKVKILNNFNSLRLNESWQRDIHLKIGISSYHPRCESYQELESLALEAC